MSDRQWWQRVRIFAKDSSLEVLDDFVLAATDYYFLWDRGFVIIA